MYTRFLWVALKSLFQKPFITNNYNESGAAFTTLHLLTNGHIKLKCLSLGKSFWPGIMYTLAYWAHSKVSKEMKCCEYGPGLWYSQNFLWFLFGQGGGGYCKNEKRTLFFTFCSLCPLPSFTMIVINVVNTSPCGNVIKLFLSVIYRFSY